MSSPTDLISGAVKRLKPKPPPSLQEVLQGSEGGPRAPEPNAASRAGLNALGAAAYGRAREHERIHAEKVAAVADRTAREDAIWERHQQQQRDAIGLSRSHKGRY
jgi:hypothetical protein